MRNYSLLFLLCLFTPSLLAQDYPIDQQSPQSALYKYYYYLSDDNYKPAQAAQVFGSSGEKDRQLALSLKQIIDGKGLLLRFESMPASKDYIDSSSHLHEYIPFPRYPSISIEKKADRWYFSDRTKEYIPKLHQQIFPFGTGWLMRILPDRGNEKFIGLKSWQWLGVVILLLTAILLHKILTWIIERITRRLIQSTSVSMNFRIAIHKMAIPASYFFLITTLDWLYPSLMLPAGVGRFVNFIFRVVEPVFLTLALYRLVDVVSLILKRKASKTETDLDDQLVPLFRKFLKAIMVLVGVLLLLRNLDFNLTALIAGVSIGGLALALAAQDTIKNMFGSLMIFIDKPFQIGDMVNLEGVTGKVEEVGFRSTRIRTLHSSTVSIPNGKITDMLIDNLGARVHRRFKTTIALTTDNHPESIERFVLAIREFIMNHPVVIPDSVNVAANDMQNNSIIVTIIVNFSGNNDESELSGRQEILLQILYLAGKFEIKLANPALIQK